MPQLSSNANFYNHMTLLCQFEVSFESVEKVTKENKLYVTKYIIKAKHVHENELASMHQHAYVDCFFSYDLLTCELYCTCSCFSAQMLFNYVFPLVKIIPCSWSWRIMSAFH